jgi:hypothetical protein
VSETSGTPAQPGQIRVKFGPDPHQEIPIHWADLFLTILHREHPQVFGQVLVKVVGAELPGRTRNRAGQ